MTSHLLAAWLVGLPLGGAPTVYFVGRLGRGGRPSRRLVAEISALAVLGLAWSAWLLAAGTPPASTAGRLGSAGFHIDGLSLFIGALALGLGTLVVLFSIDDLRGHERPEQFYALVLVEIGAVLGVACATDLFNMWLWFEVMAVASYVLTVFFRRERGALEAGAKYLVQGATGSTLALIGIALVLAQAGTVNLDEIQTRGAPSPLLLGGGALLLVGLGTKAGLVPFHMWLPDAYAQAPSGISALFSGLVTKVGLVAVLRALGPLAGVSLSWPLLLLAFGALGMLVGNLLAFRQRQLKRLLAYSSMAHLGYALLGLGIGISVGLPSSAAGGVFHLLTHAVMSGAAFLTVGALLYALRGERRTASNLSIADIAGIAKPYPLLTGVLIVSVLGLAGLPPLAGFMSKWLIFVAGFGTNDPTIVALVVFGACNSVLSLGYYAPVVAVPFRRQPSNLVARGEAVPSTMLLAPVLLGAATVALGIWPGLVAGLVQPAATVIVRGFAGG